MAYVKTLQQKKLLQIACILCLVFFVIQSLQHNSFRAAKLAYQFVTKSVTNNTLKANSTQAVLKSSIHQHHQWNGTVQNPVLSTSPTLLNVSWWPNDHWLLQCANESLEQPPRRFPKNEWRGYRLGDCIKLCSPCDPTNSFAGSLAHEYSQQACPNTHPNYAAGGNLSVVDALLKRRDGVAGFTKPDSDAIVIHLRLGDMIELSNATVGTMLTKGGDPDAYSTFRTAIKSAYELLQNIAESNATRVVVIGGSHYPRYCRKSRAYANCIEKSIRQAGYAVTMQIDSGNPDQDFYYMSHAAKIVVSAGGYSRLVGKSAVRHGGVVIGRTF